jgi:hypothetical protein
MRAVLLLAAAAAAAPAEVAAAAAAAPPSPPDDLSAALASAIFYHNGTARKTHRYEYVGMMVSYNEQDNVTCTGCSWHEGTPWPYLWQTGTTAGADRGAPPPPMSPPPMGLRSAPARGGVSPGAR